MRSVVCMGCLTLESNHKLGVIAGLVPASSIRLSRCSPKRDPRDIGAFTRVFRRAKPAGDSGKRGRLEQTRAKSALSQCKAQIAELLDRGDELVAGLEPDLLLLRIAGD